MEKKKLRFNWVDLIIILLAAAVIGGILAMRYLGMDQGGKSGVPVTCTFELQSVPNEAVAQFTAGGPVSNSETGDALGTIKEVRSEPYYYWTYSETTGSYRKIVSEEESFVYLTVEGTGSITPQDTTLSGTSVRVGTQVYLKGKGFGATAYSVGLDTEEPAAAGQSGKGDKTIVFTVQVSGVRDLTKDMLRQGDVLYTKQGDVIGTLTDVWSEPYFDYRINAQGEAVKVEVPERNRLLLTVSGRGTEKDDGYYLNGVDELKLGTTETICSGRVITGGQYREILSVGEE